MKNFERPANVTQASGEGVHAAKRMDAKKYPSGSVLDTGAVSDDMEPFMKQWMEALNSRPELLSTDLFWIAVVKRTVSLASATDGMIEAKNMVAARTLLRSHLDTLLRTHALWLVKDPQGFAESFVSDKPIRKYKDKAGRPLHDSLLVEQLAVANPWVKTVYERMSGYVHLSASHMHNALSVSEPGEYGHFQMAIGKEDDYPDSSWRELIACFRHITLLLRQRMRGYTENKREMIASRSSQTQKR